MTRWEYHLERLGNLLAYSVAEGVVKRLELSLMRQELPLMAPIEPDPESPMGLLNRLGQEGWELVTIITEAGQTAALFKRQIE